MLFIVLTIRVFFLLACAHILCPVLDGSAHVVGGVSWRQFLTIVDIGIIGSMSILIFSTTCTIVGSLKKDVAT
jgi:hypothetical protein